ncbi:MAG: deoxynucleoside kinase, partial [Candidatus Neomarinimicrobiota bacterium]|nr:deoxynucleoside kinase [Candidatus Neomarinimicrobiota bacterium]
NYCGLFSAMTAFLKKPDLIIYLKASTDTLLTRIHSRGRDYEQSIDPQYLHSLNISYERWIKSLPRKEVLVIDTDKFNIHKQEDKLQHFESMILDRLLLKSS